MAKEKKHGKAKKLPLDYMPNISNVVSSRVHRRGAHPAPESG